MPTVLIVFASTHGHTGKVAARIADALTERGAAVDLRPLADVDDLAPLDYDAVIVGGSVHSGRHQDELAAWAGAHRASLTRVPSAFFSVCMTAADDTAEACERARGYIDAFVDETGWTPRTTTSFAGAVQYPAYDLTTRVLVRVMMGRRGGPTDAQRTHEYTDWAAVERFAAESLRLATGAGGTAKTR
jgi:menaquinone-dependent protoporphyrinogen oxidase